MNRLTRLFENNKKRLLSVYFTAGYPGLNDTNRIMRALETAGADFVEVGIPFSDPVADGEVIQMSSQIALSNGMSLKLLFDQLRNIRDEVNMPIVLMGYINPVLSMGMDKFLESCQEVGIDGLILPDFPPEEYRNNFQEIFRKRNISNILLISPQTTEDRIRELDELSEGFIYMVSSFATTGARTRFTEQQTEYFKRVASLKLKNPLMTGFGVSNIETFRQACQYSSGAIVGSAFIRLLEEEGVNKDKVSAFVKSIKGEME